MLRLHTCSSPNVRVSSNSGKPHTTVGKILGHRTTFEFSARCFLNLALPYEVNVVERQIDTQALRDRVADRALVLPAS